MTRVSLLAAAGVVVIANAFTLLHVWRNRVGPVEAEVTLTNRELQQSVSAASEDDSGVDLRLVWLDGQQWNSDRYIAWLDSAKLRELGFDTSVPVSDESAQEFYRRQRSRRAFVALEFDGPAWERWFDETEATRPRDQRQSMTRLIAIDAGRDAERLRARYPDRIQVMIVPASVRISLQPYFAGSGPKFPERPARLEGWIQDMPDSIHVPLLYSEGFRKSRGDLYSVRLRYGRSLEPWIAGVEK